MYCYIRVYKGENASYRSFKEKKVTTLMSNSSPCMNKHIGRYIRQLVSVGRVIKNSLPIGLVVELTSSTKKTMTWMIEIIVIPLLGGQHKLKTFRSVFVVLKSAFLVTYELKVDSNFGSFIKLPSSDARFGDIFALCSVELAFQKN